MFLISVLDGSVLFVSLFDNCWVEGWVGSRSSGKKRKILPLSRIEFWFYVCVCVCVCVCACGRVREHIYT
jgi:hypothetical protein